MNKQEILDQNYSIFTRSKADKTLHESRKKRRRIREQEELRSNSRENANEI